MGLFRSGIEKEFAYYRRQKTFPFMDEVSYTTTQLHQEKSAILDAAHKYGKRVLVHDVYSRNLNEPSFVATPDGQWLTVEEWVESQRRRLASTKRTPAEIYRSAAAKLGPDIFTRAGFDDGVPGLAATDMWESLFEQAVERFDATLAGDSELVDEDVETALAVQAGVIIGTPQGSLPDTSDPIFHALLIAGRAGYAWRTVEKDKPKGFGFVGDKLEEVYRSVVVQGGDRSSTLCIAAEQALEDGILFQWESPGGMSRGEYFLEAAYDYALSDVLGYDGGDLAGEQALRRMFFLGVLTRDMEAFTGPPPAAANAAAEARTEQRLGRELFERDPEAYIKLAGWIVSDAVRPQLPEQLQLIVVRTIAPLLTYFDPDMKLGGEMTPLAAATSSFYVEVSTAAYQLAVTEEWEDFDAAEFNRLADQCLAVRGQSDTAEENASRVVGGVSGELDHYAPLAQYVEAQPANIRLGTFADRFTIHPGDALVAFIDEDESVSEKTGHASGLAWTSGVMLALVEKAGRVESAVP